MTTTLNFDGSSSPRLKDRAGAGYLITFPDGSEESSHTTYPGDKTNNEMEYQGLINGLTRALRLNIEDIVIKGDSQLVVRQVTGQYRVKNERLVPLHAQVKHLLTGFKSWSIEWIPREANEKADRASRSG